MKWPASWLTILIAVRLYRNGTDWMKQADIAKDFADLTNETSVYPRLTKMHESGLVERRQGGPPHKIRLSKEGGKAAGYFLEKIDMALGVEE